MEKELGRISSATFGIGGYNEGMIGLSLTLEGPGWGVSHFDGMWAIKRAEYCKWTEESRITQLGETVMRINELLEKAKVASVDKLVNIPVEVTFENRNLKSFRILEEVIG